VVGELVVAAAVLMLLVVPTLVTLLVPSPALVVAGLVVAVLGLLAGAPAGVGYHLALRRLLARRMVLPRRWWIRPTVLHDRLTADERLRVIPWFRLGAAAFVLAVGGCAAIALGVLGLAT
jgi:hypothetical protein